MPLDIRVLLLGVIFLQFHITDRGEIHSVDGRHIELIHCVLIGANINGLENRAKVAILAVSALCGANSVC